MVNRFLTFRLFCWENVRGGRHFILGARDEDEEEEGGRGGVKRKKKWRMGKKRWRMEFYRWNLVMNGGPCFLIYCSMGSVLTVKSDKYPPRDDKLRIRDDTRGLLCWRVRGWVIRDND